MVPTSNSVKTRPSALVERAEMALNFHEIRIATVEHIRSGGTMESIRNTSGGNQGDNEGRSKQ